MVNFTGDLSPDATCNYVYAGEYNDQAYLRRWDGAWFLWWDGAGMWNISTILGTKGEAYWEHAGADPLGDYTFEGTATGDGQVASGKH